LLSGTLGYTVDNWADDLHEGLGTRVVKFDRVSSDSCLAASTLRRSISNSNALNQIEHMMICITSETILQWAVIANDCLEAGEGKCAEIKTLQRHKE
jgi:hypothetical protein